MTSIELKTIDRIIIEADDAAAAAAFYTSVFDLGSRLQVRESHEPTSGFRGFVLSLVVTQPSAVDTLVRGALDGGATVVKEPKKSFWGYGGVVAAPDGTLWKIATSAKKDTGPSTGAIEQFVVLLGANDLKATKRFYVERGLTVAKSFGSKYAEFESQRSAVKLALYGRKAAAKDAGVPPEGSGSHRLTIAGHIGSCNDPDGFIWER